MPDTQTDDGRNTGRIVEIKGVVIDAVFSDRLPEIDTALAIEVAEQDGTTRTLIAEVQQHLGVDRRVVERRAGRREPGDRPDHRGQGTAREDRVGEAGDVAAGVGPRLRRPGPARHVEQVLDRHTVVGGPGEVRQVAGDRSV